MTKVRIDQGPNCPQLRSESGPNCPRSELSKVRIVLNSSIVTLGQSSSYLPSEEVGNRLEGRDLTGARGRSLDIVASAVGVHVFVCFLIYMSIFTFF